MFSGFESIFFHFMHFNFITTVIVDYPMSVATHSELLWLNTSCVDTDWEALLCF